MFDPIIIPVLALTIPIVAIVARHRRRMAELAVQAAEAGATRQPAVDAEQLRRLEERVRVLERVITDRSLDVAAQIEALRDPAPAPAREAVQ